MSFNTPETSKTTITCLLVFLGLVGCLIYAIITGALRQTGNGNISAAEVYRYDRDPAATHNTELRCIQTLTTPKIDVCLYTAVEDKYVSAQLIQDGLWQPLITKLFQKALSNYPVSDVVDLGSHIGFFAILAARMNHRVLAVEPVTSSLRRIHHAALLSGVRKNITIFHNAIYNSRTKGWLRQPHGNIGGTTVVINDSSEEANDKEAVKTILMDDLYPYIQQRIVIIKMDIEGYECRAVSSATQLFSGVHIPYIFMAWNALHRFQKTPNSICSADNVERMTIFLAHRGYVPYECESGSQLDWRHSVEWNVSDVYWRHVSAVDLRDPPATTEPPPEDIDDEDYDQIW